MTTGIDSRARDNFARDNLPPREQWPDLLLEGLDYPDQLNCVTALLDQQVLAGNGARPCLRSPIETWTYAELRARVNRIANVLTRQLGMIPGNRVLLRAPNTPMMVAAYLAVIKAGGIAVATMPLLRAGELNTIIDKARITLALCDHRLLADLQTVQHSCADLRIVAMGGKEPDDLLAMMADEADDFSACPTRADDVCLIAFTSGTTGEPKGTMHFHRDMLATCDTYGAQVLRARPDDVFIGSPADRVHLRTWCRSAVSVARRRQLDPAGAGIARTAPGRNPHACGRQFASPPQPPIERCWAGYSRATSAVLRICVSAGEPLPKPTWDAWHAATGISIMDGIGATEMLHIFIGAPVEQIRPGATGIPVPGYEAKLIDEDGNDLPRGSTGRLAVRGPTGCRYLADARQTQYVQNGWNITGDTYHQDADGYFWFQARSDDMILSSGYNISGPEVEAALLTHPAVAECGVVAAPDAARGMIVKAYVVLRDPDTADPELVQALQDHVKAEIAPYKYPRAIEFVPSLPRGGTGKLQRFVLRQQAAAVQA